MRITILLAMLIFAGCKYQSESQEGDLLMQEVTLSEPPPLDPSIPPPPPPMASNSENEEDQPLQREELNAFLGETPDKISPKIIRSIYLEMEVEDYKTSRKKLQQLFDAFKIKLYNASENRQVEKIENQTYVEVSPELLDSLVTAVEQLGLKIEQKNVSVKDRTHEYVDLKLRVASKRTLLEQYQKLLKTAKNMPDVLAIYEKLNEETMNMEYAQTELNLLRHQATMSSLNLIFYENLTTPIVKQKSFWGQVKVSLIIGWQSFLSSILYLLSLWHLWLFLTIVAVASVRGIKKLRKLRIKTAA